MDPSRFSVLARLELWQLRAFWRVARRDPVFVLAVVSFVAIAFTAVHKGTVVLSQAPAVGLFVAVALGAFAARLVFPRGGGRLREGLIAGPLHLLVCEPRDMAAWLLVRSLVLLGAIDLFAAIAVTTVSWRAALVWLVAFAIGACVLSGMEARQAAQVEPASPIGDAETALVAGRDSPASARLVLLRLVLIGRARGAPVWIVALATLALGAISAALAVRNNDSPGLGLGLGLAVAAASVGSGLLAPNGALIPVLRREPLSLPRLYAWLYGPPLAVGAIGGALVAAAAGLNLAGTAQVAITVFTLNLVSSIMLFLHQLTRSPRLAPASLGSDLLGGGVLASIEASLGFLWLIARGGWLVHRARRVRWLDS